MGWCRSAVRAIGRRVSLSLLEAFEMNMGQWLSSIQRGLRTCSTVGSSMFEILGKYHEASGQIEDISQARREAELGDRPKKACPRLFPANDLCRVIPTAGRLWGGAHAIFRFAPGN